MKEEPEEEEDDEESSTSPQLTLQEDLEDLFTEVMECKDEDLRYVNPVFLTLPSKKVNIKPGQAKTLNQ